MISPGMVFSEAIWHSPSLRASRFYSDLRGAPHSSWSRIHIDMKVELLTQGGTQQGPISVKELQSLISEEVTALDSPDDAARLIAQRLSTKSSQHKFLVSITKIGQHQIADTSVSIRSVVGAVWDEQKDGYVSLRVDDESVHLFTVYWIHVG